MEDKFLVFALSVHTRTGWRRRRSTLIQGGIEVGIDISLLAENTEQS